MIVSRSEFVEVLVDCKGYSMEEAFDIAYDYNNNLGDWITDIGGDESSINEARAYLAR